MQSGHYPNCLSMTQDPFGRKEIIYSTLDVKCGTLRVLTRVGLFDRDG